MWNHFVCCKFLLSTLRKLRNHNVEIWKFFPHDFLQKFRQSNFFTEELYCKLISRKNFQVGVNFRHYLTLPWENFSFFHFYCFFTDKFVKLKIWCFHKILVERKNIFIVEQLTRNFPSLTKYFVKTSNNYSVIQKFRYVLFTN